MEFTTRDWAFEVPTSTAADQTLGPFGGLFGHDLFDQCGRVDKVKTFTLYHLQSDGFQHR